MPDITLKDGSTISFRKIKKKKYEIRFFISSLNKTVVLHIDRNVLNLLQFEIDELLGG